MDRQGNLMVPFGKLSFEVPALMENCIAVIEGLKAAKPSGAKGGYIKRGTVSSTMWQTCTRQIAWSGHFRTPRQRLLKWPHSTAL